MSAVRRSGEHHDHHHHESPIPSLFPPGSKPGEVPTDLSHATGLERLQVLGEAEGVKVFDYEPLDASRIGTFENPVKVFSWVSLSSFLYISSYLSSKFTQDTERLVGCTGSPAESHDLIWFNLTKDSKPRCPECGSGSFQFCGAHNNLFNINYTHSVRYGFPG